MSQVIHSGKLHMESSKLMRVQTDLWRLVDVEQDACCAPCANIDRIEHVTCHTQRARQLHVTRPCSNGVRRIIASWLAHIRPSELGDKSYM